MYVELYLSYEHRYVLWNMKSACITVCPCIYKNIHGYREKYRATCVNTVDRFNKIFVSDSVISFSLSLQTYPFFHLSIKRQLVVDSYFSM